MRLISAGSKVQILSGPFLVPNACAPWSVALGNAPAWKFCFPRLKLERFETAVNLVGDYKSPLLDCSHAFSSIRNPKFLEPFIRTDAEPRYRIPLRENSFRPTTHLFCFFSNAGSRPEFHPGPIDHRPAALLQTFDPRERPPSLHR